MATIKKDFGISLYTKLSTSENEKGEALKTGFSESDTLVYPQLTENDRYIDSNYTLFSFSLSRAWVELGYFLKPRFTLIIEGRSLDEQRNFENSNKTETENTSHIKILRKKFSVGTSAVCEWNKYFGIARLSVETALLQEFNEILAVGIVMTTDDDSKPTGRIFRFNDSSGQKIENEIVSIYGNNSVENINSYINAEELCLLNGAKEEPVFSNIDIKNSRIMIAPLKIEDNYYSLSGTYMDENDNHASYKNPSYYHNAVYINFHPILSFNTQIQPNSIEIDGKQFSSFECYIRIEPNKGIYEEYKPSEIKVIYGGYQYEGKIKDDQSIVHYSNFGVFENAQGSFDEGLFYHWFLFSSKEQYRTSFKNYIFETAENSIDIPTDVNLLCGKISGKLSTNKKSNPFNINANISTDGKEFLLMGNNQEIKDLHNYIEVSARELGMINRFTGKKETDENIKIRFPVYDEYDFYFLGDSLTFKKEGEIVKRYSNTQAVVKYADMEYNVDLVSTKLQSVSNIDTNNLEIDWEIKKTKIPQNFYPDFDESSSIKTDESYFEYRKPHVSLDEEEITDKIKFYWDFDYYEILCSREFPNSNEFDNDTFRIHSLKIQDNKLYYEISAGAIGDCNENFSVNQFINYGINEKRPIGLSSFDGNKKLIITPMIGTEEVGESLLVETKNGDSTSTLKKFYTNMSHTIDIEADKVAGLSAALSAYGGTLSLKLTYYDDNNTTSENDDYLIFEFIVNDISIISGSRPLGLRKNGVIVNPKTPDEDLKNGVAEKIYLKANIETLTPEGATTPVTTASGSVIEMLVNDNNGVPLKNKEEQDIKCNIEYRGTRKNEVKEDGAIKNYYEGEFLFDGVSLSKLNEKANNNEATIQLIIKAFDGYTLSLSETVYPQSIDDAYNTYVTNLSPQDKVEKKGTITISNIPTNALIVPNVGIKILDGNSDKLKESNYSFTHEEKREGTDYIIDFNLTYKERSNQNNGCKFQVQVWLAIATPPTLS